MGSGFGISDQSGNEESALRGLAFELKNPLVNIARQAELADEGGFAAIQQTAEQTLMLLDSYLLNAQSEYGQVMLDLEPANIGSVLYDVSVKLRSQAKRNNIELLLDDRTTEQVMTHKKALSSVLSVFGSSLMQITENRQLVLRGYKTRAGLLGVGMFAKAKLSQADIDKALELQGRAHMPFASASSTAHVSMAIAGGLCRAVGGRMKVKHMGGMSGLATELPPSGQLAFV